VLAWHYGQTSVRKLCEMLGRTPHGIRDRAWRKLKIRHSRSRVSTGGFAGISVAEAASRLGYSQSAMVTLLKRHSVKIMARERKDVTSRPECPHGRRYIVKWEDAKAAVERDCQLVTVQWAADELGCSGPTLRSALVAAGHERPPIVAGARRGGHWRIAMGVAVAALAAWRERPVGAKPRAPKRG